MNLFEILSNFTHKTNRSLWIETTAKFTGKINKAAKRTKSGYVEYEHNEYEIVYEVEGKQRRAWYTFYPVPDPDVEEVKDTGIRIMYNRRKPYIVKGADEY